MVEEKEVWRPVEEIKFLRWLWRWQRRRLEWKEGWCCEQGIISLLLGR